MSDASVEAAIDGMELGAFDYLMKPCEVDLLLEKINQATTIPCDTFIKKPLRLAFRSPLIPAAQTPRR